MVLTDYLVHCVDTSVDCKFLHVYKNDSVTLIRGKI